MKIALIAFVENKGFGGTSWIGLGYLYSVLKADYFVEVLFYNFSELEKAVDEIIEQGFDMVGLSVMQFNYIVSMDFCELIKSKNKDIYTVAGNILPTLNPDKVLKSGNVDFVVIGEGEETFVDLCRCIDGTQSFEDCKGIGFVKDGAIVINEYRNKNYDLDKLVFPTRDTNSRIQTAFGIVGSRGCDGTCTFCDSKIVHGSAVRTRSIDNIMEEITELIESKNCKIISFYDSTFCTKSDKTLVRLYELYEKIKKSGLKFYFDLNIRSEQFNDDLLNILEKLCSVGLFSLLVGFEAGNDEDLKLYGKPAKVKDHFAALNALETINFFPNNDSLYIDYGFINFNPYSTIERLYKNNEFLLKARLDVTLPKLASRLLISGGAPICNKIINDGLLKNNNASVLVDPHGYNFKNEEIQKIYDVLRYCVSLVPNVINPEFMPHYILYKDIVDNSNQVEDGFEYFRKFINEYTSFSIELFFEILNGFRINNDVDKETMKNRIEGFLTANEELMKKVKTYQMRVYMQLRKSGMLLNY